VKICNDLRWMSSGPTTGLAEIHLRDLQPGSSIMPGKVNPVIPRRPCQVCAQVIGNDAAITFAGASGSFELNVMLPGDRPQPAGVDAALTERLRLLADCVDGITADASGSARTPSPRPASSPRSTSTSATRRPRRSPNGRSPRARPSGRR
jgi:fumarate hydratase class II